MNTNNGISNFNSESYVRNDNMLSAVKSNNAKKIKKHLSKHTAAVRILVFAVLAMLATSVNAFAAAPDSSATFSLSTDVAVKSQGGDFYVTGTVKNMSGLANGIYGITVDVNFDSSIFEFDSAYNGTGAMLAEGINSDFKVSANLLDANTVKVLFYANNKSGALSYLDKNVSGNLWNVFKLHFTVKSDAENGKASAFTPVNCELADAKNYGNGYENVANVTHVASSNVTVVTVGDLNGDNIVDIIDLIHFKKYSSGLLGDTSYEIYIVDCDGNGVFESSNDLVALKKYLLGVIKSLG